MRKIAEVVERITGKKVPDHELEEGELDFEAAIGPVDVTLHRFGASFSMSSTSGADRALGDLVDDIAAALGAVVDDAEAAELIEQEEADGWAPPRERRKPKKKAAKKPRKPEGDVEIAVIGDAGAPLASATTSTSVFYAQQAAGGMLRPSAATPDVPELLTDGGRYPLRGRALVCTVFQGTGAGREPKVRIRYDLDGYGRLTSIDEEPLG
jgi:hypothetical protein